MSESDNSRSSTDQSTPNYPFQQGIYPPHAYYPTQPRGFFPYPSNYLPQQGSYPFMGCPPPTGYSGINSQDSFAPPTGSENDSERSKGEDKKSQIRWNMTMDNMLLDMLVEATRAGKRKGKKWETQVWNSVSISLSQYAKEEVQVKHIENRLRQMKTEFTNFLELKDKSGTSYDPIKQMVLVSKEFWEELFSHPKEKKKFKAFRERGLKWDLEKLSFVFGNSHATGSYSQNGLDDVPITDNEMEKMSIDVEESEENTPAASSKGVHSKRQHGKRSRPIDEVKDILENMNSELSQLRQNMDPLAFGRQLREAIMSIEGFSHRFLNTAFKLLMTQGEVAKVFLITDEEGRRDILIDLSSQIGDI